MSGALPSLVVNLEANIVKFTEAMDKASYVAAHNMGRVKSSVDSLKTTFQALAGIVGSVFVFEGIQGFIDKVIEAGAAEEKLNASMLAMGSIYGVSRGSLQLVSADIQKIGIDGSEAAGAISSFLKYGLEITKLPRLAQMSADLSAIDTEGRNTRQMFELLINAIGRGPRALMQLRLGSGQAFSAMSQEIMASTNIAFLSMPQRAAVAFKLLETATKDFAGVSGSVMETYALQEQRAALAAQQFKEALFDVAKPVLSAVLQQEITGWQSLTAALQNNRQGLQQTGEAAALLAGRLAGGLGTLVSFVAAHKDWAEALVGLYGMSRLLTLVGGLAAGLAGAVVQAAKFAVGLTTLRGLVSSPWSPVVITITVIGAAAALTALRQVAEEKLAAAGIIYPNVAARPVTGGPADQVISTPGHVPTPVQRTELNQQYAVQRANNSQMMQNTLARISALENQLDLGTQGEPANRLATLEAIRAARQRQQEVKTTQPPAGGKGGGADAGERALQNFIKTMNEQMARVAGDSAAAADTWFASQSKVLDRLTAKTGESAEARDALNQAYYSKAGKLAEDFYLLVAKESGDHYAEINAQGANWLNKYQGMQAQAQKILASHPVGLDAATLSRLQWAATAKVPDLVAGMVGQQTQLQKNQDAQSALDLQKQYVDQVAGASPYLAMQLSYQQQGLDAEKQISYLKIDQLALEKKITPAQADQLRLLQAMVNQAKQFELTRKQWQLEGVSGGLKMGAFDLEQSSKTYAADTVAAWVKGAPQNIASTMATGFINGIKNSQGDLQATFTDLTYNAAQSMIQSFIQGWLNQVVPMLANSAGSSGGGGLGGILGWLFGGGGSAAPTYQIGGYNPVGAAFSARGNVFTAPSLTYISEAGQPEGGFPLARVGGELGVKASGLGGGGPQVNVIINNNHSQAQVSQQQTPQGDIIVTIEQVMAQVAGRPGPFINTLKAQGVSFSPAARRGY